MTGVQDYLRIAAAEGRELRAAGCFDVFIHPSRSAPHSNYAIPRTGAAPGADDVERLVAAFEVDGRMPRLEYVPRTAPAVEATLLEAGFEVELRTTVMTCAPESLVAPALPEGVAFEELDATSPLADVNALSRVQTEAFGEAHEPHAEPPRWLGHFIAVLARAGDVPAGGGMCLGIAQRTTELVGIGVAEPYRRRGIAGALTAELARVAFQRGARTVFLTPGDDGATRVYARAGFRPTDVMLHLRRP